MYRFEINDSFDRKSGRVISIINIIRADPGLPTQIIDIGDSRSNQITLWADSWVELNQIKADMLMKIKRNINIIRENSKIKSTFNTMEY